MRTKLKITEGIFPMPVLMVATYNEDGSVNVNCKICTIMLAIEFNLMRWC